MPRYIEINCNEEMKNIICTALRNFAVIAYPKTPNSECNLVASDALLNAANEFDKSFTDTGKGLINRRLRMILKTAIEAHYKIKSELDNSNTTHQCAIILKLCDGEIVEPDQLRVAEKLDQSV